MSHSEHNYQLAMRQNAGAAAFGAALLLFFGFYYLAEPSRGDLFGKSAWIFYHTLRIGGVVTAAIALWLWTGHRPALVVDALVAGVIGIVFVLTGMGMLLDGGDMLQVIIIAFCGVLFIRAAMGSAQLYMQTRPARKLETLAYPAAPVDIPAAIRRNPPERRGPSSDSRSEPSHAAAQPPPPSQPPPEGYLASLAKKRAVQNPSPSQGETRE